MKKKEEKSGFLNVSPWIFFGSVISLGIIGYAIWLGSSSPLPYSKTFSILDLNEQGDFIAGVAGSLAFIWLVIAVRLQSIELAAQKNELNIANTHHKQQVEEMKLARDLGESQLEQSKREFALLKKQYIEHSENAMIENICYKIWYEITPLYLISFSVKSVYYQCVPENKHSYSVLQITNALVGKNFNLAFRLIVSFYEAITKRSHKIRVEVLNNSDGYHYTELNGHLCELHYLIFEYLEQTTKNIISFPLQKIIIFMTSSIDIKSHDPTYRSMFEVDCTALTEDTRKVWVDHLKANNHLIEKFCTAKSQENFQALIQEVEVQDNLNKV